jgi:3-dehydroquinate synthase class II
LTDTISRKLESKIDNKLISKSKRRELEDGFKKGKVMNEVLDKPTVASFVLWVIPQDNDTTFIVTDYEGYLDGAKNIHEVLQESIDIEYQNLRNEKISPMDYVAITEVTSSQVTTQISEFVTSKPSEQWQESYISYMNGMKKFNEYILETKVLANQIENESLDAEILETIDRIESIKVESIEYIKKSNELRP